MNGVTGMWNKAILTWDPPRHPFPRRPPAAWPRPPCTPASGWAPEIWTARWGTACWQSGSPSGSWCRQIYSQNFSSGPGSRGQARTSRPSVTHVSADTLVFLQPFLMLGRFWRDAIFTVVEEIPVYVNVFNWHFYLPPTHKRTRLQKKHRALPQSMLWLKRWEQRHHLNTYVNKRPTLQKVAKYKHSYPSETLDQDQAITAPRLKRLNQLFLFFF